MHELDTSLLLALAGALVLWTLVSGRLERIGISAPMAMVAAGFVLTEGPGRILSVNVHSSTVLTLSEITLALLLFSDASVVKPRQLQSDAIVPARLLFIGLPLTIALGTVIATLLFGGVNPWVAAAIAAVVSPTDASLGAPVMEDERVPGRIRRILNVESGLNDGIATPFVSFLIAGAVAESVSRPSVSLAGALGDLGVGVVAGIVLGAAGGWLVVRCTARGWASTSHRGMAALGLAICCYASAVELGGNGFIAAFVGGLAFGAFIPADAHDRELELDAEVGELLSFVVWFLFGAAMVPLLAGTTWQTVVFAALALTVVRMVPVAISLIGTGFRPAAVGFIGWFGPRGLASVVFGLIAFDALEGTAATDMVRAVTLTVLASIVAHGVSAAPLVRRYADRLDQEMVKVPSA